MFKTYLDRDNGVMLLCHLVWVRDYSLNCEICGIWPSQLFVRDNFFGNKTKEVTCFAFSAHQQKLP